MAGARLPGIGSHHSANPQTDEWLTPPAILERLGPFDLDPCAAIRQPWPTAARMFTALDDGQAQPWEGRVWLNPPYSEIAPWMALMAKHRHGIALVFARCDTAWWHDHVWPHAVGYLFLRGRLTFRYGDGTGSKSGHNSGGPSVLIAYTAADADRLLTCELPGAFVPRAMPVGEGAGFST